MPITDSDLQRLVEHTQRPAKDLVGWVTAQQIDLDDEPEAFVRLRSGRRVMILRHVRGGCVLLDSKNRCSAYQARPLGCRVFPFDSKFDRAGKLQRLELIQATDCSHDRSGKQSVPTIRRQQLSFLDEVDAYQAKIGAFNQLQRSRGQKGRSLMTSADFLRFLGFR